MATMAMISAKCLALNNPKLPIPSPSTKPITKPMQNLPKPLITPQTPSLTGAAIAGAIFATIGTIEPAIAAQQIAEIAKGSDNRGLALLLPIIPAIGWVLFNILQPALNQINRMRSDKGVIIGLGLSGLVANGLFLTSPQAQASEIAIIAAGDDNRGQLLLFVVLPAIGWVLYNILQPALNQINRMRSQ